MSISCPPGMCPGPTAEPRRGKASSRPSRQGPDVVRGSRCLLGLAFPSGFKERVFAAGCAIPDKTNDRQNTVSGIQKYEQRKGINILSEVISTFCLTKKLPTVYGLCKWCGGAEAAALHVRAPGKHAPRVPGLVLT